MAGEALTPTSYIQHHLHNLTFHMQEGGFWAIHVDTIVTSVLMGLLMVFATKVGLDAVFSEPFNYIFGGICLLYGGFRIYRGIRRNYYR